MSKKPSSVRTCARSGWRAPFPFAPGIPCCDREHRRRARTSEILAFRVDHLEHGVRVVGVAHRVEVDNKVLVRLVEEELEAGAGDDVVRRAPHLDDRPHRRLVRPHPVCVHQRLVQVQHEVELAMVQLVLRVRRQERAVGEVEVGGRREALC
jgi:hypothetical protein